jgi:hypothetical protein
MNEQQIIKDIEFLKASDRERLASCGELVDLAAGDVCGETSVAEQFDKTLERLIDAKIAGAIKRLSNAGLTT